MYADEELLLGGLLIPSAAELNAWNLRFFRFAVGGAGACIRFSRICETS
jgi:hypothetical protein